MWTFSTHDVANDDDDHDDNFSLFSRSFSIVNPTNQLYSFEWLCEDEVDPKKPSAFRCLTPKGQIRSGKKSIVSTCIQLFHIRKTCPCNIYPLKPHFYIVKLGYAGVYLFFLFLLQNIDCGYSLEPPWRGGSKVYPQSMF